MLSSKILDLIEPLDVTLCASLPKTGECNTIYITSDKRMYIYINNEWQDLGYYSENEDKSTTKETYTINRVNCKNCGAPLVDGKCQYCGSDFRIFTKEERYA